MGKRKISAAQGVLFASTPVIAHCTKCGGQIILSEPAGKYNRSERQNRDGYCWGCSLEAQVAESRRRGASGQI